MMPPHVVTFTQDGGQTYGLQTGDGIIDLGRDFPQWPPQREGIAADALKQVVKAAAGRGADFGPFAIGSDQGLASEKERAPGRDKSQRRRQVVSA